MILRCKQALHMWLSGGVPQTEGLVLLFFWRHQDCILKSVRTCKSSMKLSSICLCFLTFPLPLFFHFPVPLLCHVLPFPPQGRRKGWRTGWASSSGCMGTRCLCAALPCVLLGQVVLDGRDTAWLDIYSCFLRKPDSLEELGSSVGSAEWETVGAGMGGKPVSLSSGGNLHPRQRGPGGRGHEEAIPWQPGFRKLREISGVRRDTLGSEDFFWKWCTPIGDMGLKENTPRFAAAWGAPVISE